MDRLINWRRTGTGIEVDALDDSGNLTGPYHACHSDEAYEIIGLLHRECRPVFNEWVRQHRRDLLPLMVPDRVARLASEARAYWALSRR